MKTSRRWFQSLLVVTGGLLVSLPGVPANAGGTAVGSVGVAAASNGAHAGGGASAGGSHSASAGGPGRSSTMASAGTSSAAMYRTSGFSAGGLRGSLGLPSSGKAFGPRYGTASAGAYPGSSTIARNNNAWSEPSDRATTGGAAASRSGYQAGGRIDPVYYERPGNHLYPGAAGDGSNRFSDGRSSHDGGGNRGHHRYYYNNFPYGVYYPYLYNNYGYGDSGYGGAVADYSGVNADASAADLAAPGASNSPNNYYSYVAPEQEPAGANANQAAPTPALPDAPDVGPQTPAASDQAAVPSQGPDSLVEAVQNELARRGYFAGHPDSMYSPATKQAIRRFQTDQGLPATGRINEATLHALHLD